MAKKSKVLGSSDVESKNNVDEDDLASMFQQIKSSKRNETTLNREKESKKSLTTAPKIKKDGLFRKPEVSMELSDQEFFNSKLVKGKITDSKADDALKAREGVDKIVSMNQLQKMLSHNPKAGTTPNCPFDCDCCF